MLSHKKLNPIKAELIITERKLNISLVFIKQSCFAVPKNFELNSTYYFVMKIPNKRNFNKLQLIIHQILTWKDLWNFVKSPPYLLFIDTALPLNNSISFRKNLLETM